jgi:hypothetical protein
MASGGEFGGNGFLVPARNTALVVWCLAQSLRVAEMGTLMGTGLYNEPGGAWLPSFAYSTRMRVQLLAWKVGRTPSGFATANSHDVAPAIPRDFTMIGHLAGNFAM